MDPHVNLISSSLLSFLSLLPHSLLARLPRLDDGPASALTLCGGAAAAHAHAQCGGSVPTSLSLLSRRRGGQRGKIARRLKVAQHGKPARPPTAARCKLVLASAAAARTLMGVAETATPSYGPRSLVTGRGRKRIDKKKIFTLAVDFNIPQVYVHLHVWLTQGMI